MENQTMYNYKMTQTLDSPQTSDTYLEYMIEKLGADGLTEFSEKQQKWIDDQKLVFLLREFVDSTCIINRVFTERDCAETFMAEMTTLLEKSENINVDNYKHEIDAIDYDQFAELESRDGVKNYFWYQE